MCDKLCDTEWVPHGRTRPDQEGLCVCVALQEARRAARWAKTRIRSPELDGMDVDDLAHEVLAKAGSFRPRAQP